MCGPLGPKVQQEGKSQWAACSGLWVRFSVVLLVDPEAVWEGTAQGYGCRAAGTTSGPLLPQSANTGSLYVLYSQCP